jgi:NAD(P)-dependent dehydrogenase (short-subunit alcohol dehydrogenase family)
MPQHPALSKDCVAVITGGASGIGLAAAKRFAAIGMKLVLADLRQDALDRAAAQLPGAELVTVPTDVSKIDEVNRLKDRAYAAFGAVDVLMNNAGTSPAAAPSTITSAGSACSRSISGASSTASMPSPR